MAWENRIGDGEMVGRDTEIAKYKYYERQGRVEGKPMIEQDELIFKGRRKKMFGLLPRQAKLVVEFMSGRDGEWKEAEIMSNLRDSWERFGMDRGKITFFCRAVKDINGKHIFKVTGNRPRSIRWLPLESR